MKLTKAGQFAVALFFFASPPVIAQAADSSLSGYTPPPMFGAPAPVAKPAAPVQTPAVAPTTIPSAPKEFYKVTTPPDDKETIVKDEPLPIETVRPDRPKPTSVPNKGSDIPPYIPPVKAKKTDTPKTADIKPGEKTQLPVISQEDSGVKAQTVVPATKIAPPANIRTIQPAKISAEDLLSHPVTSESDVPMANPMAVPAASVEDALPLPGSVPPSPKRQDVKKAEPKKVEAKTEIKKDAKKAEEKKPEPKKADTKKTDVKKTAPKNGPAKAEVKKEADKKAQPKKVETRTTEPKKIEPKQAEQKVVPAQKATVKTETSDKFHLEGKKNMPTVKPTKVEKEVLPGSKPPLPDPSNIKPVAVPSVNEKMIDKALETHIVEPDVKSIEKSAPPIGKSVKDAAKSEEKKTQAGNVGGPSADQVATDIIGLGYKGNTTSLAADQKSTLDKTLLPKLADKGSSVQILAYSEPTKDSISGARRISLNRGLAIRDYLMQKGVAPDRIMIKALGENSKEKPLDRADLLVIPAK